MGFLKEEEYNRFHFPLPIPLKTKLNDVIDFENKKDQKYYYTKDKCKFYDNLINEMSDYTSIYQWKRVYVRQNKSGVCPTLTANMGTGGHNVPLINTKNGIRKLTPRECFNLQGYPKDHILPDNVSNGRLYKAAGNSVVVTVIQRIAENIFNSLSDEN